MNKKISTPIAIGIILILAVLVAVFTLWQYSKTQKELSYPLPEIKLPERKIETQNTSSAETAGWKTYTDKEYGFEVKYPADWRVKPIGDVNMVFCPPEYFEEKNDGWLGSTGDGCAMKRRVWPADCSNTCLIEGIGEVSEKEYKEKWEAKINKPFFNIYLFFKEVESPDISWEFQANLNKFSEYKETYEQIENSFKILSTNEEQKKETEQTVLSFYKCYLQEKNNNLNFKDTLNKCDYLESDYKQILLKDKENKDLPYSEIPWTDLIIFELKNTDINIYSINAKIVKDGNALVIISFPYEVSGGMEIEVRLNLINGEWRIYDIRNDYTMG